MSYLELKNPVSRCSNSHNLYENLNSYLSFHFKRYLIFLQASLSEVWYKNELSSIINHLKPIFNVFVARRVYLQLERKAVIIVPKSRWLPNLLWYLEMKSNIFLFTRFTCSGFSFCFSSRLVCLASIVFSSIYRTNILIGDVLYWTT